MRARETFPRTELEPLQYPDDPRLSENPNRAREWVEKIFSDFKKPGGIVASRDNLQKAIGRSVVTVTEKRSVRRDWSPGVEMIQFSGARDLGTETVEIAKEKLSKAERKVVEDLLQRTRFMRLITRLREREIFLDEPEVAQAVADGILKVEIRNTGEETEWGTADPNGVDYVTFSYAPDPDYVVSYFPKDTFGAIEQQALQKLTMTSAERKAKKWLARRKARQRAARSPIGIPNVSLSADWAGAGSEEGLEEPLDLGELAEQYRMQKHEQAQRRFESIAERIVRGEIGLEDPEVEQATRDGILEITEHTEYESTPGGGLDIRNPRTVVILRGPQGLGGGRREIVIGKDEILHTGQDAGARNEHEDLGGMHARIHRMNEDLDHWTRELARLTQELREITKK